MAAVGVVLICPVCFVSGMYTNHQNVCEKTLKTRHFWNLNIFNLFYVASGPIGFNITICSSYLVLFWYSNLEMFWLYLFVLWNYQPKQRTTISKKINKNKIHFCILLIWYPPKWVIEWFLIYVRKGHITQHPHTLPQLNPGNLSVSVPDEKSHVKTRMSRIKWVA